MDMPTAYRSRLIDAGLLIPTGVDGLFGRSGTFESIYDGVDQAVTAVGAGAGAEVMRFPPAMAQATFEKTGYMKNFPHFAGTVHCFCGDERSHQKLIGRMDRGETWTDEQEPADLVLTPAACYAVYPVLAKRGPLGDGGHMVDVSSYCFRHEPSQEPTRMQLFRMREYVRIGTEAQVIDFRGSWIERGKAFADALALPYEVDVANDPFFGRAGKFMASSQREQALKFELLIPVNDGAGPTACLSFNYHQTYFGDNWDIRTPDGAPAHTACIAFGMERIVLALFKHHGFDVAAWPAEVRSALALR